VDTTSLIALRSTGAARLIRVAVVLALGVTVVGCDLVKVTAPASRSPAPSVAVPSAAPSAASAADLVGHQYVLDTVKAFRSDPLVAHVVYAATLTSSQGSQTVKATVAMTLDLSGRELKSVFVIKSGGKSTQAELVVVGKNAYARSGGGAWTKAPRNGVEKDVSDTIAGMRLIDDPRDLRYVGPETIDARQLQHLTADRKIPYQASNGATGQYDTFDIWITEDGTPVLVKATYSAKQGSISVKGTTRFGFSKFGGPIKIVAPKTK
jgi:hypothetical protein